MKRRNMISFFSLLFITILVISFFIILIGREKRSQQEAAEEAANQQITAAPTITQAPTSAPEPTVTPAASAQLFPAYQIVDKSKKYGYINQSGDYIIKPYFDSASDFHDGVAVVTLGGENLLIDDRGKILYNNSTTLSDFANGTAIFSEGSNEKTLYGYIDAKGNTIIDAKYDYAEEFREDNTAYVHTPDGEYCLIDKSGNVLESYKVNKKYDGYGNFHDGYLIYSKIVTKDDISSTVFGVVNVKGDEILKPVYSQIRYLGGGFFAATKPGLQPFEAMASKEALFNQSGEQLTDYSYYTIGNFYNGYMSATDDSSTFFIDTTGNKAANLPVFDGIGTMILSGDVIEATIDGQKIYSTPNKLIFWQEDQSVELSDSLVVNTMKYRLNRFALIKYPQVEGIDDSAVQDTVNQTLQSLFLDARKSTVVDMNTEIEDTFTASLLGNLLIIEKTGYDFPFGAAHGMPIMDYYYIDIRTGASYQLKDLFLENKEYTAKINDMIASEITANLASSSPMYFPDSVKAIPELKNFRLDKDSLIIYFYPYDIAPYAAGFPEFLIPFKDISEYINEEGDFWKSFHE